MHCRLFWKEIAHYEGPDPLEVWLRCDFILLISACSTRSCALCPEACRHCRFIKWTQDTFKSGGHRAEVLPLLERCTRELQYNAQYKDDVRYLRVWIQYVRGTAFLPYLLHETVFYFYCTS